MLYFLRSHCYMTLTVIFSFILPLQVMANPSDPRQALQATPIYFEPNQGQTDDEVAFISKNPGYHLFLTPDKAVVSLNTQLANIQDGHVKQANSTSFSQYFVNANRSPQLSAEQQLQSQSFYYKGKPEQWIKHVPHYAKVRYQALYQGIDLVYYGNPRQLEYDLIVAPQADPQQIKMAFTGIQNSQLDAQGNLKLHIDAQVVTLEKPIIYQNNANGRQPIAGHYILLANNQVGFDIGTYNPDQPLIIDPVLTYSSYLGGTKVDGGRGIAAVNDDIVYVVGDTTSTDFPATSGTLNGTSSDITLTKFDLSQPAASQLQFSIYFGGSNIDFSSGLTLNNSEQPAITGGTLSSDFALMNAFQSTLQGSLDAFVTRFDSNGNLLYSSYLGGANFDRGHDIVAFAPSNDVFIIGRTSTVNLPTSINAFQSAYGGGSSDALIAQFDTSKAGAASLKYLSYLGGTSFDEGLGIDVDSSGQVMYLTGATDSSNTDANPFPTTINAVQANNAGGRDAFISALSTSGTMVYSSYLGGSTSENFGTAGDIVHDGNIVYVTGSTASADFFQQNPIQPVFGGQIDAFLYVIDLNPRLSPTTLLSTFIGGSGDDTGISIALSSIDIHVAGQTSSDADFPLTPDALQSIHGGLNDAFLVSINRFSPILTYASYFGGIYNDFAEAMTVSGNSLFMTGETGSPNLPLTNNANDLAYNGSTDSFLARFDLAATLVPLVVNNSGDTDDGACDNHCTLREAINISNNSPGFDVILIIPTSTPPSVISPLSNLPIITDPVIIKANQMGDIMLDGSNLSTGGIGLQVNAGLSTIQNLLINNFDVGIKLTGGGFNHIAGNYIGLGSNGMSVLPNDIGILIESDNNIIGGNNLQHKNVISGNTSYGIKITAGAAANQILGNTIGLTADGMAKTTPSMQGAGIKIENGSNSNVIGEPIENSGNLISGNINHGVHVTSSTFTKIQNNVIGTNIDATMVLGNGQNGVLIENAMDTTIGGILNNPNSSLVTNMNNNTKNIVSGFFDNTVSNLISGNGANGIEISLSSNNTIHSNFIGTNIQGDNLGNSMNGIKLTNNVNNSAIGSVVNDSGNNIAFNGANGVVVSTNSISNQIRANHIYDNAQLGIDLNADGIDTNDLDDTDSGANNTQNYPVITNVISSIGTNVIGTLDSVASTVYILDFFQSQTCDPSNHGEGQQYLGSALKTSDNVGHIDFNETFSGTLNPGDAITATATESVAGHTSEFSACFIMLGGSNNVDLMLTKVASNSLIDVGDNLTYTLTITNNGPNTANGVTVTDTLPLGVSVNSANASQGSCTAGSQVVCGVGTVTSSQSITITINVTVNASVGANITNVAAVTTSSTDTNMLNNSANVSTTVNRPPVVANLQVATSFETSVNLTVMATDLDGDTLSFTIETPVSHGMVTGSGPNYTYTPDEEFAGVDTFQVIANDGRVDSNIATITIVVQPPNSSNHPPLANSGSATTAFGVPLNLSVTANDIDGDSLSFMLVNQPSHGALVGSGPNYTYTPNSGFFGTDNFQFKANDGQADSNIATFVIIVRSPIVSNLPPVAIPGATTTPINTAVTITLNASDSDSSSLNFMIVSPPSHGSLSNGSGAMKIYTPNSDFTGTDSFQFKANDGQLDSNIATFNIVVSPRPNHPPVVTDGIESTTEDVAVDITVRAVDIDNDNLTFMIVDVPTHGSLAGNGPDFRYTPENGFTGIDRFTVKANDGQDDSNIATININVMPKLNQAPVASDKMLMLVANRPVGISVEAMDPDQDPLSFMIVSPPTQGKLTGDGPNYLYVPNAGAAGTDQFTFKANDGTADSNIATVSIKFDFEILTEQLPDGLQGIAYQFLLSATDLSRNLRWELVAPSVLPPGLSLLATGQIQGVPTQSGDFPVTIQVTNASGNVRQKDFVLSIKLADQALASLTPKLPDALLGHAINNIPLLLTGGVPPYECQLASGTLPPGILLNHCALSGIPTQAGSFSFTVKISDSSTPALTGELLFSLTVFSDTPIPAGESPVLIETAQSVMPDISSSSPGGNFADESLENITTDVYGNQYLLGFAFNGKTYDIQLLKFDISGQLLWTQAFDSNNHDYGYGIAINPVDQSIYVAGFTLVNARYQALLLNYDSMGKLQWQRLFRRGFGVDTFYALHSNEQGVFAVGESYNGTNFDALMTFYSPQGELRWDNTLPTFNNGTAYAVSQHCETCPLFVAGAQGAQQLNNGWLAALDAETGAVNQNIEIAFPILAMLTNLDGAPIIGGTANHNWHISRLDESLTSVWESIVDNSNDDLLRALAIDHEGFIYATGRSFNGNNHDVILNAFNQSGEVVTELVFDQGYDERGHGLVIDSQGRLFVAGQERIDSNVKFLLFRVQNGKAFEIINLEN